MRDMFRDFMEELRRRQEELRGQSGQSQTGGSNPPEEPAKEDRSVSSNGSDPGDRYSGPAWSRRGRRYAGGEAPQLRIGRGWVIFGIVLAVLLAVLILGYLIVYIWTDAIWFGSVGYASVFWTRLNTQVLFFVLGTGVALAALLFNVWLAARLSPKGGLRRFSLDDFLERMNPEHREGGRPAGSRLNVTPGEEVDLDDLTRPVSWGTVGLAVLIALILGAVAVGGWTTIQLFLHRVPFAQNDPIFGKNIGFFVFELPFYRLIQSYGNGVLLASIVLAGVRYLLPLISGASLPTAARVHMGILAMLYLWSVAIGYQLDRYELVYSHQNGIFEGVGYTDASARFLALNVMTVLAVVAGFFVAVFAYFRLRITLSLTILTWLAASVVLGWAYPTLVQRLAVDPNQQGQESTYINYNIEMTRLAFDLDNWQGPQYQPQSTVSQAAVESEQATIQNVRLWDYRPLGATLDQLQVIRQYYSFADVDTDRYVFTDSTSCAPAAPPCVRQVMIAGRDFDPAKYASANKGDVSWVNLHITYTHGVGLVMVPVNEVGQGGQPNLLIKDLPPSSASGAPTITEPRIYFGTQPSDYVVVNGASPEFDYPSSTGTGGDAYTTWQGDTGIKLDTPFSRLLFAARFGDLNLFISNQITGDGRLLMRRSIQERVQSIAPFLRYDKDPYLVVTSSGRLVYILDAFTTTNAFPNANSYDPGSDSVKSGLAGDKFNYIRNSVKVVMDAYDGTMTFYVIDPGDPIIATWQGVFPDLFRPISDLPSDLRSHLRYPEDMFNAQTTVFEKYHVTDAGVFYQGNDVWQVPQNSSSTSGSGPNPPEQLPLEAYYVQMRMPGSAEPEFLLLQPMVPNDRKNMISWVAAHMDPTTYGQVSVFDFPRNSNVFGPEQIEGLIAQNDKISQQISLWAQGGSQVILGNLLVLPLQDSLLYIEPVYLVSTSNPMPIFQRVVVATPTQVVWGVSLQDALNQIYAGQGAVIPGGSPSPGASPSASPSGTATPAPGASPTPASSFSTDAQVLIAQANQHYEAAQAALRNGDLATYQTEMDEVGRLLTQLEKVVGTPAPSPSGQ
jgi:uncharacterized membrane protein (UPF0182 family)